MSHRKFEYGPLAVGIFMALVAVIAPVGMYFPEWQLYYLLFLFFLGFGLRPVLEVTGLLAVCESVLESLRERWNRKFVEQKRRQVDRKVRDEKYRKSRYRDPRLPKNW
jgi:hypothetical protein